MKENKNEKSNSENLSINEKTKPKTAQEIDETIDFLDWYEGKITAMIDPECQMDYFSLYRELIRIEMRNVLNERIRQNRISKVLLKLEESLNELHELIAPLSISILDPNQSLDSDRELIL